MLSVMQKNNYRRQNYQQDQEIHNFEDSDSGEGQVKIKLYLRKKQLCEVF